MPLPALAPLAFALLAWADPPAPADPPASALDLVAALETALADAIAKAQPSVVAVSRFKAEGGETTAIRGRNPEPRRADPVIIGDVDPQADDYNPFDSGSGVVIGDGGEVLTNYHLVAGAARLIVRGSGRPSFDAEIIAADPRSDLAVIVPRVLAAPGAAGLPPIVLGDAGKLRQGAFLVALGNPFNAARRDGKASASWGILSNTARRLERPISATTGFPVLTRRLYHHPTLLQLDSKLNLGMSGGAVINLKGELVGLTTASADAEGFDARAGYAIPIDALGRRIIETLRQGKEVEYGFLGIQIDGKVTNQVHEVQPGTPAAEGGLVAGDLVVRVGDIAIGNDDSLSLVLSGCPPGKPIKLGVQRLDKLLERTVVLSKFPVDGAIIATNRPAPWRGLRVDFTSLMGSADLPHVALQAMALGGVVVTEVAAGSPADIAGLKKDHIITAVAGRPVRSPDDFAKAVAGHRGPVTLSTQFGPITVK
jgi:serine protease Do